MNEENHPHDLYKAHFPAGIQLIRHTNLLSTNVGQLRLCLILASEVLFCVLFWWGVSHVINERCLFGAPLGAALVLLCG